MESISQLGTHKMIESALATSAAPRIAQYKAAGGYPSFVRIWDVPNPVARVVYLHGIISHGGWYLDSCGHLAEAGCAVHFLERRGSGLNVEQRGDVDQLQTWIDDVAIYLEDLGSDVPRILLGVSWGGKLAVAIARDRPHLIDAFGMLCPGMFAQHGANRLQKRLLTIANRTALRSRRVKIPLQDPALFTDSPQWRTYIDRDPLTLREITLRFARADMQLEASLADSARHIHTPALLMLAGRDRIVGNDRLRKYFGELASSSKELIEYPEAAHTLEFEPDPLPYFRDLTRWVISQTSSANMAVRTGRPR